jgi:hypothetical protein
MNLDLETPPDLVKATSGGWSTRSGSALAVTVSGRNRRVRSQGSGAKSAPRVRLPLLASTARDAVRARARATRREPIANAAARTTHARAASAFDWVEATQHTEAGG